MLLLHLLCSSPTLMVTGATAKKNELLTLIGDGAVYRPAK